MEGFFQQGMQQLVSYQKDLTGKKTRNQKKSQKIQKLKHDMNDPQMKKQRHQIRRKQDKNKLKKQLQNMTKQQARIFLDQRKLKKKQAKQKILKALKQGQFIYIDMVFEKKMNQKQNKSLAIQIQLIMKAIKHLQIPPGIHLCDIGGVVQTQLQKMSYHYWTLQSHKQDILQVSSGHKKKLVYLSPDAPQPLQSVQDDTAYIIGGLVDRTVIKNASYDRARQLQIQARHLPIKQMIINRSCLNLDHVVMILMKFKQCKNWKEAFQFGAPKRWKKNEKDQKKKVKKGERNLEEEGQGYEANHNQYQSSNQQQHSNQIKNTEN